MSAIILLGFMGVVGTGVGGLGYLLYQSHQAAIRARGATLDQLCALYGLRRAGERVFGSVGGTIISFEFMWRSQGKSQVPYTTASARWTPPLDLGLSVTHVGDFDGVLNSVLGKKDIQVGDRKFDERMRVLGDDVGRTSMLLTPALRNILLELRDVHVYDGEAVYDRRDHLVDVSYAFGVVERLVAIARIVGEQRPHMPLAPALAPFEGAFSMFAHRFGLSLSRCPLAVWGIIDGCQTLCFARRKASWTYEMVVNISFPSALGIGLNVGAETWQDRMPLFGRKDFETGDVAFDRTFKIHAANEERLGSTFDAPLRDKLRALHDRYPLKITDEGISTTLATLDALATVPQVVPQLQEAALDLFRKLGGAQDKKAAYR